ncbi:MAG: YbaB/EbfC family nucleoid-associated protein [Kiritimatiellae bacterium]|nr:YbaB/EbfC family nucleoid-associated protein [Kiritimatiellia bacterium]
MPNIMKVIKQVNKMKADLAEAQTELSNRVLEYSAGGGAIKIGITGTGQVQSVKLDPSVVDPSDVSGLEDLLLSAIRGAQALAQETSQAEMAKITGGINLPPGLDLGL